ncbi:MAG: threonine--tRNA ligase [bacterium]|nr:threonine--tRNA ligase [bacterium]
MKKQPNKINQIRHSLSHLLAMAVLEKFPKAQLGIGPVIENGFYYDFLLPRPIEENELGEIEKIMRGFIKQNIVFKKKEVSFSEAEKLFKSLKQPFKVELARNLKKFGTTEAGEKTRTKAKKASLYYSADFVDLCAGPHVRSTKEIQPDSFKLEKIAGAYWRGNEKNKMLTRIYGLAFETKKELDEYLQLIKEAQRRDHRKLGQELDLFSIHEEFGPGLVYWHPKGARIRVAMEDFWRKAHYKNGYDIVFTPHIGKSTLWETSGHLGFYKENMYSPMEIDKDKYYIKPMNCPFHILIYKNKTRSYRELPLRWAELGTVYRYEKAGVLHGLLRVRGFTQDDAHLICTPEQMPDEIKRVLDFSLYMLRSFGFQDFHIYLATRPDDAIGEKKRWDDAIKALENALKKSKLSYGIDNGGGTFYGPKIDIKIKDALGREWQCTTIQFDFNMPERFKMEYIGADGKAHQPYMIHRALMGSLERFFATVVEHFGGAFPFWLAPIQIKILPIGKNHQKFAEKVKNVFNEHDFRAEVDESDETVGKRIREAEMQKIPYIIVVGDKEMNSNNLAVRTRGKKEIETMTTEKFLEICQEQLPKI